MRWADGRQKCAHLSGSNGVDCALDGADHIVDFKTLQGLSHYNNTSTTPGATLEKRQKAAPFLLVTKSSPPSGGGLRKKKL